MVFTEHADVLVPGRPAGQQLAQLRPPDGPQMLLKLKHERCYVQFDDGNSQNQLQRITLQMCL